jgi:hypothetical protein
VSADASYIAVAMKTLGAQPAIPIAATRSFVVAAPGEALVAEALVTSQRPVREAIVTEMRALRADRG